MNSSLCCTWPVMMTLTMLFLLPNVALSHLASTLRAGSGTLTKFTLGDHIIFCTFTNSGEGKPPILSHVRVSREPQSRIVYKGEGPLLQTSKIKSPSYQHKILQFHSNGQTSSDQDFYPTKLIVSNYPATNSFPVYPVASKFGKVDTKQLIGSSSTGNLITDDDTDEDDSWEMHSHKWEPNLLPETDEPTYTPYIGARALTNIPKFFEHLRENMQALYQNKRDLSSEEEEDEGYRSSKAGEELHVIDKIATPTRRGYSSNSEARLLENEVDGDLTSRDSRSYNPFVLESEAMSENGNNAEPDEKTKELLQFLRQRTEYPKANNYNPSWLFTNLGFGKRNGANMH